MIEHLIFMVIRMGVLSALWCNENPMKHNPLMRMQCALADIYNHIVLHNIVSEGTGISCDHVTICSINLSLCIAIGWDNKGEQGRRGVIFETHYAVLQTGTGKSTQATAVLRLRA